MFLLTDYTHICVIQLSACDVTSGNVLGTYVLCQQKGGTGGNGQVSTLNPGNILLGLALESPWSELGGTNRLRKRSSGHVGPPFLAVRLFSHSVRATIGQEL